LIKLWHFIVSLVKNILSNQKDGVLRKHSGIVPHSVSVFRYLIQND
jgi:hypothetical protein